MLEPLVCALRWIHTFHRDGSLSIQFVWLSYLLPGLNLLDFIENECSGRQSGGWLILAD